jgi:hypothetical protein
VTLNTWKQKWVWDEIPGNKRWVSWRIQTLLWREEWPSLVPVAVAQPRRLCRGSIWRGRGASRWTSAASSDIARSAITDTSIYQGKQIWKMQKLNTGQSVVWIVPCTALGPWAPSLTSSLIWIAVGARLAKIKHMTHIKIRDKTESI